MGTSIFLQDLTESSNIKIHSDDIMRIATILLSHLGLMDRPRHVAKARTTVNIDIIATPPQVNLPTGCTRQIGDEQIITSGPPRSDRGEKAPPALPSWKSFSVARSLKCNVNQSTLCSSSAPPPEKMRRKLKITTSIQIAFFFQEVVIYVPHNNNEPVEVSTGAPQRKKL